MQAGRRTLIDAFFEASWPEQSAERLGHVQQLLTVNCENIGNVIITLSSGIQALLSVVALLGAAFVVNAVAAAVVLAFGVVLFVILRPFNSWGRRENTHLAADILSLGTTVTEYARLTREFRVFGVEWRATQQLHTRNDRAAASFRRTRVVGQLNPVIYQTFALAFVTAGVALFAHQGNIALGSTGAVLLLILRSLTYGSSVQSTVLQLNSFQAFFDGIKADLLRYRSEPPSGGPAQPVGTFDVRFEHVDFHYDGRALALDDVSFSVPNGKVLGIVGRSGSGKTTLSQILLGMREPTRGGAFLGGVPVSEVAKGDGVSPVALVAQDPVLLQGSVASNIAFFRDITGPDIVAAARAAHLHEDVAAMPDAYETAVGEGGGALSGGQRQRLAIARALVGSPRLLVLDEPTSALDGRSESLVRQTLREVHGRMTVVIISHRLAMVEDCDLLLVLEGGKVADFGPRDTVSAGPAFRTVADEAVHGLQKRALATHRDPTQPDPVR